MHIVNRLVATTLMAIAAGISNAAAAAELTPPKPRNGICADRSR
ncbi:hypothetical protein FBZ93_103296 [Bradyrhizobium macuxiense]|uniref:Uncharacterized protein n=1 Tax=Bradyrhizobium macuxiense TaxID=1755647 RepID=A0A560MCF7_9BRAD|nr:hypothetical protein [Bradyrhizobium macuxiense]TWC05282.1 hypothetical protein FBZ93_103296 [Bradyrhizobium macuxiense]